MFEKGYKSWNSGTSKTKVTVTCQYCGKQTTQYLHGRKEGKYCSNDCSSKVIKGENSSMFGKIGKLHPCWKAGGKNRFKKFLRTTYDYRKWRTSIFERDDYTCQDCKKRGGYLEVHHKISLVKILDDYKIDDLDKALLCPILWDIDNGITYCTQCHSKNDEKRKIKGQIELKSI